MHSAVITTFENRDPSRSAFQVIPMKLFSNRTVFVLLSSVYDKGV